MSQIAELTQQLVARAKNYQSDTVPGDYATLLSPCPKCGGEVKENYKRFACSNCDFSITKIPGSRQFEIPEVEHLLTEKTIGPLQGFRSKIGRPFAAMLKITPEFKLEFDFGQNDDDSESQEPIDFSAQTSLGACPKCSSNVFEHGMSYLCEKSVGPEKSCDFKSGKVILQQPIEPEQMRRLLGIDGRTDLLQNFVSSRTKRKFKAFLRRGPDGKVGFEFEPRPVKSTATSKAGGAKTSLSKTAASEDSNTAALTSAPVSKKAATKKPATTKTPAKKAPAKKPAAKKAAAKKPAAKKSAAKKAAAKK